MKNPEIHLDFRVFLKLFVVGMQDTEQIDKRTCNSYNKYIILFFLIKWPAAILSYHRHDTPPWAAKNELISFFAAAPQAAVKAAE